MKAIDVSFAYGGKAILERFSLSLPDTGITALAGPSGCGKTTLLRLLAGLERPICGRLEVPGQAAFLFQENRLLPGLCAAEQICAVLPRGVPAQPWLDAVGLRSEASTMPDALSGGMQRRLALARCLAYGRDKGFFLLDEPFTGIDPALAQTLMAFIRTLGKPVVFSAHGAESLALADTVVHLNGLPLKQV